MLLRPTPPTVQELDLTQLALWTVAGHGLRTATVALVVWFAAGLALVVASWS